MILLLFIFGLTALILMFAIASLSDRVDKLQHQIDDDSVLLNSVAEDVYRDRE